MATNSRHLIAFICPSVASIWRSSAVRSWPVRAEACSLCSSSICSTSETRRSHQLCNFLSAHKLHPLFCYHFLLMAEKKDLQIKI